ncbi:hypothetical protein IFO70_24065 [Phormidium tenue FACHB-886]|nr:hypothetical protein [Phormidium tenue FACHB-886]
MLVEILARTTLLPVREVQNGMKVEPNHVYVIPPNTQMTLTADKPSLLPQILADDTDSILCLCLGYKFRPQTRSCRLCLCVSLSTAGRKLQQSVPSNPALFHQ